MNTHLPGGSSVTQERVDEICFALMAVDQTPSFNLVYERLGRRGSSAVVQRCMADWRVRVGQAGANTPERSGMIQELVAEADKLVMALYTTAKATAEKELEARRQEVEASLTHGRQRLAEEEDRHARTRMDLAEVRHQLELAQKDYQQVHDANQALQAECNQLRLNKVTLTEQLQSRDESLLLATAQHAVTIERLTGEHVAERAANEQKSALERERLLGECEQLRLRANQLSEQAEATAASHRHQIDSLREELRQAGKQASRLESTTADLQRELLTLKDQVKIAAEAHAQVEASLSVAKGEAIELRTALTTAVSRNEVLEERVSSEVRRADRAEELLGLALRRHSIAGGTPNDGHSST
jgi:chromosome segregation ATPase